MGVSKVPSKEEYRMSPRGEGLKGEGEEKKEKGCVYWTAMLNSEGSPKICLSFMLEPTKDKGKTVFQRTISCSRS